jgi:hypothetical protein
MIKLHPLPPTVERQDSGLASIKSGLAALRDFDAAFGRFDGARAAREKNLTFLRIVRVQPCIRPLNAAVLAAGPDVIR